MSAILAEFVRQNQVDYYMYNFNLVTNNSIVFYRSLVSQ